LSGIGLPFWPLAALALVLYLIGMPPCCVMRPIGSATCSTPLMAVQPGGQPAADRRRARRAASGSPSGFAIAGT
jgi:hypothetical protein